MNTAAIPAVRYAHWLASAFLTVLLGAEAPLDVATERAATRGSEAGAVVVHAEGRGNLWVVLHDGYVLSEGGQGSAAARPDTVLGEPLSLAASALDGNWIPELISGYGSRTAAPLCKQPAALDNCSPSLLAIPSAVAPSLGMFFIAFPPIASSTTTERGYARILIPFGGS